MQIALFCDMVPKKRRHDSHHEPQILMKYATSFRRIFNVFDTDLTSAQQNIFGFDMRFDTFHQNLRPAVDSLKDLFSFKDFRISRSIHDFELRT